MDRLNAQFPSNRKRKQLPKKQKEYQSKKQKKDEFALLSLNKLKVVFDIYTPRPHFIIAYYDDVKHRASDYSQTLFTKGSKLELVNAATRMISKYELKGKLVLSIHRGSWVSDDKNFHAHLCADVKDYLQVYKTKKTEIPKDQKPKEYADNVRAYRKSYYKVERQYTRLLRLKKKKPPTSRRTFENYTLLYHPSEAKVGFALIKKQIRKSADSLVHTLDAMNRFAVWQDMANVKAKKTEYNRGCHICLVLSKDDYG